jgi:high-affinity K+ transport system ATPase subunit B
MEWDRDCVGFLFRCYSDSKIDFPGFQSKIPNVLVIDKTGTLTEGQPKVTAVIAAADRSESDLLRMAASLERLSEHPPVGGKRGSATATIQHLRETSYAVRVVPFAPSL